MGAVRTTSLALADDAVGMKFTDTLEIDQQTRLLYLGDNWSGGVDVFDLSSGAAIYLETIKIRGAIYGICVAHNVGKLFVGILPSAVAVIDIRPESPERHTVITRIDTGGRGHSDLVDFDPVHQKLYIANRNDGFLLAIDALTDTVVAKIDGLGGGLEQPRFNPNDEMVYLAGNADNVLYQVDPTSDRLVATHKIGVPCSPNGLAINPGTNQGLFAGSDRASPNTVIWDFGTQAVAEVIEGCGCGDGAVYIPGIDRYLLAASGFPEGPVIGIFSGSPASLLATVPSHRRSSWVAYDETGGVAYAPTVISGKPGLLSFSLADIPGAAPAG